MRKSTKHTAKETAVPVPSMSDPRAAATRTAPAAQVQTFVAASMPEALSLVKRALGADAVILGTRTIEPGCLRSLVGGRRVEISAAPGSPHAPHRMKAPPRPNPAPPPRSPKTSLPPTPQSAPISDLVHPYYIKLVQNQVSEELAAELVRVAATRGTPPETALRECIAALVPDAGGITLTPGQPRRVALVGPSGSGKTTAAAKLAARFKLRERKRVILVTLDTRKICGPDQLERFGEIIGVPVIVARTPEDLSAAEPAMRRADLVLIDTPGVGVRDNGAGETLRSQLAQLSPEETHLVVPASLTPATHAGVAAAFLPLAISHVLLTRLDDATGFGVILGAMQKLHWRLSYLSNGQSIPNDLIEACSHNMAELIFPARATGSSP